MHSTETGGLRMPRVGLGQDSHPFTDEEKPLLLAGVHIPDAPGLAGNSDADLIFHTLTNAISGISGKNILGPPADELCHSGVTDSRVYLEAALETLAEHPHAPRPYHVSISVEGKRPRLWPHIPEIREAVAHALNLPLTSVGFTATTGDGLTSFGRGEGLACFAVLTCLDSK